MQNIGENTMPIAFGDFKIGYKIVNRLGLYTQTENITKPGKVNFLFLKRLTGFVTNYESITVAKPTTYNIDKLNEDIEGLLTCKDKLSKLKEIVPEFNHQKNI